MANELYRLSRLLGKVFSLVVKRIIFHKNGAGRITMIRLLKRRSRGAIETCDSVVDSVVDSDADSWQTAC